MRLSFPVGGSQLAAPLAAAIEPPPALSARPAFSRLLGHIGAVLGPALAGWRRTGPGRRSTSPRHFGDLQQGGLAIRGRRVHGSGAPASRSPCSPMRLCSAGYQPSNWPLAVGRSSKSGPPAPPSVLVSAWRRWRLAPARHPLAGNSPGSRRRVLSLAAIPSRHPQLSGSAHQQREGLGRSGLRRSLRKWLGAGFQRRRQRLLRLQRIHVQVLERAIAARRVRTSWAASLAPSAAARAKRRRRCHHGMAPAASARSAVRRATEAPRPFKGAGR